VRNYRDLRVWQVAFDLSLRTYEATKNFPKSEEFGLKGQIRRAGVSIPANIAEGAGRGSDPEFLRFVRISIGSLNELETLLLIANALGYVSETFEKDLRNVGVLLRNLAGKLDKKNIQRNEG
jgi:four helix bundle protein